MTPLGAGTEAHELAGREQSASPYSKWYLVTFPPGSISAPNSAETVVTDDTVVDFDLTSGGAENATGAATSQTISQVDSATTMTVKVPPITSRPLVI
ncbi:MAG: hypothetical protein ACLGG5_02920 [Thermoleophilia bacterium]